MEEDARCRLRPLRRARLSYQHPYTMPTTPPKPRRWPQEVWAHTRKRRPSSSALDVVAEKLREEASARESLHDYCHTLTLRIEALELLVQGLAAKVEMNTEELMPPTLGDVGATVSMHGSSAISLSGSWTWSRARTTSTAELPMEAPSLPTRTAGP